MPPRFASWLLARRLDPNDRDEVLGDLAEDFLERQAVHGPATARLWYWRQVFHLAWSLGQSGGLDATAGKLMMLDELRYSVRRLARQPWTTGASVLTLACAIGSVVATWSLLSATLLHPLDVDDPSRLTVVGGRYQSSPTSPPGPVSLALNYSAFETVRSSRIFADVAGSAKWAQQVEIAGVPALRGTSFVSAGFFHVLGRPMQAGREFSPADDQRRAPLTVILSDALWRSAFGANPHVVGQSITVHSSIARIIGVAPSNFRGVDLGSPSELFMPLNIIGEVTPPQLDWFNEPGPMKVSAGNWIRVIGRLRPIATTAQTTAALAALRGTGRTGSTLGAIDGTLRTVGIETAALSDSARGDMTRFVRLLGATVALLLTIGCLAVGTLLLVRTESRRDELFVCLALGASRARLAAGIVSEGALVAGIGAALAIPLGLWLLIGLREFQLPGGVAMSVLRVRLDLSAVVVAVTAAFFATLLMAIVAAHVGLSASGAEALRSRAGATPRASRRRTRRALVISAIAVSLVLLSGARLFAKSVAAALALAPGYDTSHLLIGYMTVNSAGQGLTDRDFSEFRDRLERSPEIRSASIKTALSPAAPGSSMVVDGQTRTLTSAMSVEGIDDHYFSTIGLPIAEGRDLIRTDQSPGQPMGIVSASFGRFVAQAESPIGHHVEVFSWFGEKPYNVEIVGVVPDIITDVHILDPMALYVPSALLARFPGRIVVIHAAADVTAATREIRALVATMSPMTAPPAMTTIEQRLAEQMGPQRLGATIMGALGVIAALLTLFGVFVLVQSTTVLRRRELGLRSALGATERQLRALVLRELVAMTAAGLVGGLFLAWLAAGLIRTFLFRVGPFDASTLSLVAGSLFALALVISARPVLAAGRVDLAQILRES